LKKEIEEEAADEEIFKLAFAFSLTIVMWMSHWWFSERI